MKHYSFIKEELEDSTVLYGFLTSKNLIYTISFSNSEYVDFLYTYPTLLSRGYGLSIFRHGKKESQDEQVLTTIIKVILDFLTGTPHAVLLYNCYTADNRQASRDRLFDNWCKHPLLIDFAWKHSVEVDVHRPNGTLETNFLGCVASKSNPFLTEIQDEFEAFAIQLLDINNSKQQAG